MPNTLFLIPARSGSKGLPKKNVKYLRNKPLIGYSIEFALENAKQNDVVCISTNDNEVIEIAKKNYALDVPFIRPEELSNDTASTFEVIIHALNFYLKKEIFFNKILLLQPTSPFRTKSDFDQINTIYNSTNADMVVSVKKSKENPYFNMFQENENGFLNKIINSTTYNTRQACPPVYVYNGSMYLVNTDKFLKTKDFNFENIKKFEIPESRSIDIDTEADWVLAEYFEKFFNENN